MKGLSACSACATEGARSLSLAKSVIVALAKSSAFASRASAWGGVWCGAAGAGISGAFFCEPPKTRVSISPTKVFSFSISDRLSPLPDSGGAVSLSSGFRLGERREQDHLRGPASAPLQPSFLTRHIFCARSGSRLTGGLIPGGLRRTHSRPLAIQMPGRPDGLRCRPRRRLWRSRSRSGRLRDGSPRRGFLFRSAAALSQAPRPEAGAAPWDGIDGGLRPLVLGRCGCVAGFAPPDKR